MIGPDGTHILPTYLLLYATLYGGYGTLSPFLPAFLKERGLSPQEIAVFLASATLARIVAGPLAGRIADRSGARRGVLAACLGLTGACTLALLAGHGFAALLGLGLAQAVASAPLGPLADALALAAAAGGRVFEYGWVRAAGSMAFIAATVLTGFLVAGAGYAAGLWASATAFAVAAVAALRVAAGAEGGVSHPDPHPEASAQADLEGGHEGSRRALEPSEPAARNLTTVEGGGEGESGPAAGRADGDSAPAGFRALLAIPRFRRLVLVASLVIGAHAMHDAFAVIAWSGAGIGPRAAGLLWSESVAAEIAVFLWLGPRLLAWLGAPRTLALCAGAGALRWAVQGAGADLPALVAIQALHGLSFAALHLACIGLIEGCVPERLRATALTVYGAFGLGLASALVTLAAGPFYAALGLHAFWAMSALSLAAVPLALSLR